MHEERTTRSREAGFTLIEALISIVVMMVGLMAVSNLFLIASSSNLAANRGTVAVAAAMETMERLKIVPFNQLVAGGSLTVNTPNDACDQPIPIGFCRIDDRPGSGQILTRWVVVSVNPQTYFIRVQSEALGPLMGPRTRADFTSFRSCTASANDGCPAAP